VSVSLPLRASQPITDVLITAGKHVYLQLNDDDYTQSRQQLARVNDLRTWTITPRDHVSYQSTIQHR